MLWCRVLGGRRAARALLSAPHQATQCPADPASLSATCDQGLGEGAILGTMPLGFLLGLPGGHDAHHLLHACPR